MDAFAGNLRRIGRFRGCVWGFLDTYCGHRCFIAERHWIGAVRECRTNVSVQGDRDDV
jgi:hypothetical protein